jgi:regulatory factor X
VCYLKQVLVRLLILYTCSANPRPSLDTTILNTDDQALPSPAFSNMQIPHRPDGYIFVDPLEPGFHPPSLKTSNSYEQHLEFHPPPKNLSSDVLEMPDIWAWVPKGTDVDAADALVALYRSHCTSLVDSVRFCKEKTFFKLFGTFQGTLTVPVGKLFADPRVAGWVKECDWLVYQKMLEQLYPLTLQVMPVQVMRFLDNISRNLHHHITQKYSQVPRHLLEAKLEPANLFCELVGRMLKVNQTAHAAARVVESREFRESLLKDWVHFVNPKRIMESELPGCGYVETYKIITQDIPSLLSPIPRDVWSSSDTHYRDTIIPVSDEEEPAEPIVDQIGSWLSSLPSRFPNASARTLVDCIKNIGTAAMRDMTIGGAVSFNAWWILKVYVDEMVQWLASSGGFLGHQSPQHTRSSSPPSNSGAPLANGIHESNGAEGSQQASRYGSMDVDFTAHNGGIQLPTHQSNSGHNSNTGQHQSRQ